MKTLLVVILAVLNVISAMLHSLGFYLVTYQYRNGLKNPQQLYLINLSASESMLNILQLLTISSERKNVSSNVTYVLSPFRRGQHYVRMFREYGIVTAYYATMVYLTADKLLEIYLNIRYHLYCNNKRTINLLVVTWCATAATAIAVSITYHKIKFDVYKVLDLYVYPSLDIVFLLLALLTYGFIFNTFKKTRQPPVRSRTLKSCEQNATTSTLAIFRKSRFYIPLMLISSFVVPVAIPDFIQTALVACDCWKDDHFVTTSLRIAWASSYLVDALNYIWVNPSVRRLLKRKLGNARVTPSQSLWSRAS